MMNGTVRSCLPLLIALVFLPAALADAQKIDDLVNANRIEYTLCKYKAARMHDEARQVDSTKADLPGMEKQAAELQAKLDALNPKYRDAQIKAAALEREQASLGAELPTAEQECREAWVPSLSGACSRRNRITKRLYEEVNPELARLRGELAPLGQERQKCEDTLAVLSMNVQSRRNYLARTTRPTDGEIAEQERRCQLMELSMGLDTAATKPALTIAVSAPEGTVGDEISLGALLSAADPRARYGYVWSINGRVFGDNRPGVRTAIPAEGVNTVRVVAWRWTGSQWAKTAEAAREVTGKARVQQTVSIAGPSSVTIQDAPLTVTFEARVSPEVPGEQYGYTWGATGGSRGPVTFNSHTKTQSLSAATPGRYDILVHAWKLVNGRWIFVSKASLPFAIERAAAAPPTGRQLSTPRGLLPAGR